MHFLKHVSSSTTRVVSSTADLQRFLYRAIHRGYYDALGLTPKASQADIKHAYYNLSMQFHPDKTKGNDERFREITAAYEVLGNLKLRRMYDRGILLKDGRVPPDVQSETGDQHMESEDSFARGAKSRVPTTGRSTVYNFDEWTKSHYSDTFSRRESAKTNWETKKTVMGLRKEQARTETALWVFGAFILGCSFLLSLGLKPDPDVPSSARKSGKS